MEELADLCPVHRSSPEHYLWGPPEIWTDRFPGNRLPLILPMLHHSGHHIQDQSNLLVLHADPPRTLAGTAV